MTEMTIYTVKVPDKGSKTRCLKFYARQKGHVYEAICLGFAAHDKPLNEESELEYHERGAREAATRAMRLKNTFIEDSKGNVFDQRWKNQAVLVALWRKLEKLEFLKLPKNPFLRNTPPEHIDVVDFDERLSIFINWERELASQLEHINEKYGKKGKKNGQA